MNLELCCMVMNIKLKFSESQHVSPARYMWHFVGLLVSLCIYSSILFDSVPALSETTPIVKYAKEGS